MGIIDCAPEALTTLLWTCAMAAVLVFAVMIYSVVTFHRSSAGAAAFNLNRVAEVIWAIVPIAIICAAASPAFRAPVSDTCVAEVAAAVQEPMR
jgi:heme/copper-type cytochrome/quinol oxidase subunit 2